MYSPAPPVRTAPTAASINTVAYHVEMTTPDAPADRYTHGHHQSVLASHKARTAENSAAYLVPYLKPGLRVLDVGCGPGTISTDFARMVSPGEVVALDRSQEIVAQAAELAFQEGIHNLTATVGDVYHLDYPSDSFDVTHAHQVLQHLSDPVAALREMARVTKPGGTIAVRDADYAAMAWYPADERLDTWQSVYHAVAHANDAEPDAARHLLSWARQAGLNNIRPLASVWCWADDATRQWWGGLWAERVQHSALAEQALEGGFASSATLAEIADAFREWSSNPDGWFTVLNGELLATPAIDQDDAG